jgi:hypothetical protein
VTAAAKPASRGCGLRTVERACGRNRVARKNDLAGAAEPARSQSTGFEQSAVVRVDTVVAVEVLGRLRDAIEG